MMRRTTFKLTILGLIPVIVFNLLNGCSEPPPSKPDVTGAIRIESTIRIDSVTTQHPELVGVVLDTDSLGYYHCPSLIDNVPTGQHLLDIFAQYDGTIFRSTKQTVTVIFASTTNVVSNLTHIGYVMLAGKLDGIPVDSIRIVLDGIDLGKETNPRLLESVSSGVHKVKIQYNVDTLIYEGWQNIAVESAETTMVDIDLFNVAPFENHHALDITSTDAQGNLCSLQDHWGEVIFLYFFRST